MPVTMRQIVTDSMIEIGVLDPDESPTSTQANLGLQKLIRLFNLWNGQRRAVYATAFLEFTLTPNLSPHTIGPSGATFSATIRPVSIDGANLILTDVDPVIDQPINIRDNQWWLTQTIKGLETGYPTDLYYQPDWPNGKLYFWPVPTTAWGVQLMARVLLDEAITLDSTFTLPPGYREAVTLTLAEMLCRPFGKTSSADLRLDATRARGQVFGNNAQIPRLRTKDAGMTTALGPRPKFNYLIGSDNPG